MGNKKKVTPKKKLYFETLHGIESTGDDVLSVGVWFADSSKNLLLSFGIAGSHQGLCGGDRGWVEFCFRLKVQVWAI